MASGAQAHTGNGLSTDMAPRGPGNAAYISSNSNAEIMQVLRALQESITNKDAVIQQLQETIKGD